MSARSSLVLLALLLLGPALAGPASAEGTSGCGWLPDLTCDRRARPEGFAPPNTSPYFFEDPFITTEVSTWALWHDFPESSVFSGGDARVLAVQVRVALTERLGLVATKDGRIWLRPDNDLLDTEQGYGDMALGFKYALIHRPEQRFVLTPSLRYELSQGTRDVLQGNGEGVWIPGLSLGWGVGPTTLLAGVGARLPLDGDEESSSLFYNLHVALPLTERWGAFAALNGIHYLDDGDGGLLLKLGSGARVPLSAVQALLRTGAFEGLDVANLGSDDIHGHDFVSLALGVRVRVGSRIWLGLAYERPLTRRRDIMKQRATLNVVFTY